MTNCKRSYLPVLIAALALCQMLITAAVQAQTVVEQVPSLALVPEDASAYGVLLNNNDVYEAIVNSKAYAKIAGMEEVKPMLDDMKLQWEQATGDPAMKGLIMTALDAISEEVFFYTDSSYARLMKVYQQANAQGSLLAAAQGAEGPDSMVQLKGMLDVLADHSDELETPKMVIGMRVKDAEAAAGLVSFIKLQLGPQLAEAELEDRLVDEEVGGVKLSTLKLDGAMVPWDEMPLDEISGEPGKYDRLITRLRGMTLAISLGVKDNYLLLSVGPTSELIGTLGNGKGLGSREEFARLADLTGKKMRSITYVSKEGAELTTEASVAPLAAMANAIPLALPEDIDGMLKARIEADAKEFAKDFQSEIPAAGAMLSATTFSPRGFDTVTYNWTENKLLDSSKPLTLLNHLGGSPIAYYVARGKSDPQRYELAVKWLKKADGYMTQMAEQEGGENAERYQKFRADIDPLLTRLDKANREMLMPALKDGQSGMILDAQITSTQWFAQMPESTHPLPMLELAMVMGVSDADKLKEGCREYFAVAQEVADILHEIDPDEVPKTEIPAPKERDIGQGTIYYYMLPKDMGIDKRIAPNAGLSDSVAVLSLAPLHSKRILEKTAITSSGPITQYKDKPLSSASGFNFARTVDAITPWIEYSIMNFGGEFEVQDFDDDFGPGPGPDGFGGPGPDDVMKYIHTAADLLKCFQGYSSVTYEENGAQVTRGEWHFQDLE